MQISKCSVPSFIISWSVQTKGVHPRHPPRAFPLELRVPRCLCAGKQNLKRLKYQEMSRLEFARNFLGRGSFLSPGRALLSTGVCPRHPHSTFFNLSFVVSLSLRSQHCNSGQALVL